MIFTGVDVGFSPVFRGIRGKVAIYNENLRAIAQKHDCIVADQWALAEIQDQRMWIATGCTSTRSATTRWRGWCCARSTSRTTSSP